MGLELYAKIEPILGFEEEAEELYDIFIEILRSWRPDSLIDIGCGSGKFLQKVQKELSLDRSLGVDLSETMVDRAKKRGLEAKVLDICSVEERFEAATAVFDVLNYLSERELKRFMGCVEALLEPGAIFVADINTLFGFEEVAQGALVRENKKALLVLDSSFEDGVMSTAINYFEHDRGECYTRKRDLIKQYYHDIKRITDSTSLELIQSYPLSLYGDEPDKEVLLFKK